MKMVYSLYLWLWPLSFCLSCSSWDSTAQVFKPFFLSHSVQCIFRHLDIWLPHYLLSTANCLYVFTHCGMCLHHQLWRCVSAPPCSPKTTVIFGTTPLTSYWSDRYDSYQDSHIFIVFLWSWRYGKYTLAPSYVIFREFPLGCQSLTITSLIPQKPTKPYNKMSSFLNCVSAGEEKIIKANKVCNRFLPVGRPAWRLNCRMCVTETAAHKRPSVCLGQEVTPGNPEYGSQPKSREHQKVCRPTSNNSPERQQPRL